jgi:hypothetical protein
MDEHAEAELFEQLWAKFEPIGKKMFHDCMTFLTEQAKGIPPENSLTNDLLTSYLSLIMAYAKALDLQETAMGIEPTLGDFSGELPSE